MNNGLTELVIKRSEWLTPDKDIDACHGSCLLNNRGLKCCLGFACLALGATKEQILGKSLPKSIFIDKLYPKSIFIHKLYQEKFSQFVLVKTLGGLPLNIPIDTELSLNAAKINDNRLITNEEREKELIELFGDNNIKLSFIDS